MAFKACLVAMWSATAVFVVVLASPMVGQVPMLALLVLCLSGTAVSVLSVWIWVLGTSPTSRS